MRYGHTRQIVVAPRKPKGGPACEKCRGIAFAKMGDGWTPFCSRGLPLGTAAMCGEFDDVSIDRSINE